MSKHSIKYVFQVHHPTCNKQIVAMMHFNSTLVFLKNPIRDICRKSLCLYFVFYELSFKCPHLHQTVLSIRFEGDFPLKARSVGQCSHCHDSRHFNLQHGLSGSRWLHFSSFFFPSFMSGSMWEIQSPWFPPSEIKTLKTHDH